MENAAYVIEAARSGRSVCKGACKETIGNGQTRLGSIKVSGIGFGGGDAVFWRCAPCITAKVASNVAAKYGGGVELVPGFDGLSSAEQTRTRAIFDARLAEGEVKAALKQAAAEAKVKAKEAKLKARERKAAAAVAKKAAAAKKREAAAKKKLAAAAKKAKAAEAKAAAAESKKRAREEAAVAAAEAEAAAAAVAEAPAAAAAEAPPAKKAKKASSRRRPPRRRPLRRAAPRSARPSAERCANSFRHVMHSARSNTLRPMPSADEQQQR